MIDYVVQKDCHADVHNNNFDRTYGSEKFQLLTILTYLLTPIQIEPYDLTYKLRAEKRFLVSTLPIKRMLHPKAITLLIEQVYIRFMICLPSHVADEVSSSFEGDTSRDNSFFSFSLVSVTLTILRHSFDL